MTYYDDDIYDYDDYEDYDLDDDYEDKPKVSAKDVLKKAGEGLKKAGNAIGKFAVGLTYAAASGIMTISIIVINIRCNSC